MSSKLTLSTVQHLESNHADRPDDLAGRHGMARTPHQVNPRIGVLALAGFALGTEAFVFVGHLDAMAATLDVPVAAVGQLATAFAFSSAISTRAFGSVMTSMLLGSMPSSGVFGETRASTLNMSWPCWLVDAALNFWISI
eukprot:gene822-1029_t